MKTASIQFQNWTLLSWWNQCWKINHSRIHFPLQPRNDSKMVDPTLLQKHMISMRSKYLNIDFENWIRCKLYLLKCFESRFIFLNNNSDTINKGYAHPYPPSIQYHNPSSNSSSCYCPSSSPPNPPTNLITSIFRINYPSILR